MTLNIVINQKKYPNTLFSIFLCIYLQQNAKIGCTSKVKMNKFILHFIRLALPLSQN